MPTETGRRLRLAFVYFAMMGLAGSCVQAEAAAKARLSPDEAREAVSFVTSMSAGDVSLTGFHCSVISASSEIQAFNDDLDDMETLPTIGLEFAFEVGGSPPHAAGNRAGRDEMQGMETRSPLSARLSRILIEGGGFSLTDGGGMGEVSLPEASMSVADLIGRCHP